MKTGGAFLTTPFGEGEIFTRERFSGEQLELYEAVRDFSRENLATKKEAIETLDEALNREILLEMGEMGMLGVDVPDAYGGMGMDKSTACLILEALSHCDSPSLCTTYTDHTGIGLLPILWYGNDQQREKYIPKMMTGEWLSSYALTEPGAGSDALAGTASAKLSEDGSHYILSGTKQWITNGGWADIGIVFAKVDGEKLTAFILDKECEGWERGPEEKKLGIKGNSTTTYVLNNCKVPVENVIGTVGKGAAVAFNVLYIGRLKLGAVTMGGAKNAIRHALTYANERRQFAQPIVNFGMMQRKLADMVVRQFEADCITYQTTGSIDEGVGEKSPEAPDYYDSLYRVIEDHAIENSVNKIYSSEGLWITVDDGLQILGGYGFSEEYPFARLLRDERVNRIFEGTNEINKLIIAGITMKKAILDEIPIREEIAALGQGWLPEIEYPEDHDMLPEIKVVELGRGIVLRTLNALILEYGQDFKNQQWEMELLANMIIAQQVMFSVLRRYLQLPDDYPRKSEMQDVVMVSLAKQLDVIVREAKTIHNHILDPEAAAENAQSLQAVVDELAYLPDTLAAKERIFRLLHKRDRYPFND
jgi:alkylation response protein AidB-like acyl-CoA dehydrogenase